MSLGSGILFLSVSRGGRKGVCALMEGRVLLFLSYGRKGGDCVFLYVFV